MDEAFEVPRSWFFVFLNKRCSSLKKGPKPACILESEMGVPKPELGFGRTKIGLPTFPAVLWTYQDGCGRIPCRFVDVPRWVCPHSLPFCGRTVMGVAIFPAGSWMYRDGGGRIPCGFVDVP